MDFCGKIPGWSGVGVCEWRGWVVQVVRNPLMWATCLYLCMPVPWGWKQEVLDHTTTFFEVYFDRQHNKLRAWALKSDCLTPLLPNFVTVEPHFHFLICNTNHIGLFWRLALCKALRTAQCIGSAKMLAFTVDSWTMWELGELMPLPQKSTCNFIIGPPYPWFHICRFNWDSLLLKPCGVLLYLFIEKKICPIVGPCNLMASGPFRVSCICVWGSCGFRVEYLPLIQSLEMLSHLQVLTLFLPGKRDELKIS